MVTIHPEGSDAARLAGRAASALPASLLRSGLVSAGDLRGREQARETIRSGFTAIDALLPGGGLRRGSLVEWLAGAGATACGAGGSTATGDPAAADVTSGAGAVSLAVAVACRLAAAPAGPKTIVVVDRGGWFHPPAVLPWLDDSRQLVVARPSHDDDEIWAIDQALRCRGVAAVVAWPRGVAGRSAWGSREPTTTGGRRGGTKPGSQWTIAMRRWQLAARASGAIGLLVRPAAAAREPSWAEARLAVAPVPGGTLRERRLEVVKVGGSWSGGLEGREAEMVLDLARGCEGRLSREPGRAFGPPQRREPVADWWLDLQAGGLACRAS